VYYCPTSLVSKRYEPIETTTTQMPARIVKLNIMGNIDEPRIAPLISQPVEWKFIARDS